MRWIAIPSNETGEDFDGYKLKYFYKGMPEQTNTTEVQLPQIPNGINPNYKMEEIDGVSFLYYTIPNLNPRALYWVWVLGYNMYGDGEPTPNGNPLQRGRDSGGNSEGHRPGANRKRQYVFF